METNPYSPPNSELITEKPAKKTILWWIYFSIMLMMIAVGMVGSYLSDNINPIFLLSAILDIFFIIGLYGYIREKKILSDTFWAMIFIIFIIKMSVATFAFFNNYMTYIQDSNERLVALIGSLTFILAIPLICALWRYTFKTPTIWITK